MASQELKTREQWEELLGSVDTVLFDCDGVLWSGYADAISGAQDVIQFLRSKGKAVYFVSNNSSKSRVEYLEKFKLLDFEAHENEVFPSGYVAAYYLKHMMQLQGKVYLLGMPGFGHELDLQGIRYIGPGPDPIQGTGADWLATPLDPEVEAVVVGFDVHFSYAKMIKALSYLRDPNCHFIATNEDPTLPAKSKVVIPGTGCFVKCIKWGADREPTVMGKPHKPMFDVIQHSTKLDPARTLMIGDRLSTDIAFGRNHGMKSLLVFTGSCQRADLAAAKPESCPDYHCNSVADILLCRP